MGSSLAHVLTLERVKHIAVGLEHRFPDGPIYNLFEVL